MARQPDDVTEWPSSRAEFFGLASNDRREWRRGVARASIWMIAGAVSLLANAEVFLLFAHRDIGETAAGSPDPVVMIDLPAPAITPAMPGRPDAAPNISREVPRDARAAESASREPDPPAPPEAATPPEAAPADVPPLQVPPSEAQPPRKPPMVVSALQVPSATQTPEPWSAAPLPVPRPRGRRMAERARRTVGSLSPKSVAPAAVARSAHAEALRRASRMASASAFAGSPSAADWKSLVVAALNRAKRYPDGTEAVGSPTIRMMVAASGDVARVSIVASSGSSVLDSAALETVRRTSPLPPPPGGETGLTFRMNFHLRSP